MVEIYPEIKRTALIFDKSNPDDLAQDIALKCLENEEELKDIVSRGKLKDWLFIVARNLNYTKRKRERSTDLPKELTDENHQHPFINAKSLEEMLALLNEKDRMWISTWVELDFSYVEIQRKTGITRQHAKVRIKSILEKWKHLEIFLPSLD